VRQSRWVRPQPEYREGVMAKYIPLVGSAAEGALTSKIY
jgi:dihydroxy-acid dehydratase